jgi:hypothetical protein
MLVATILSYSLNLVSLARPAALHRILRNQRDAVASFLMTAPKARGKSAALEIAHGCNSAQGGAASLSLKI